MPKHRQAPGFASKRCALLGFDRARLLRASGSACVRAYRYRAGRAVGTDGRTDDARAVRRQCVRSFRHCQVAYAWAARVRWELPGNTYGSMPVSIPVPAKGTDWPAGPPVACPAADALMTDVSQFGKTCLHTRPTLRDSLRLPPLITSLEIPAVVTAGQR
eukprot:COSAG02_NODE_1362_length_13050_cov_22.164775_10_plen_160_part_00